MSVVISRMNSLLAVASLIEYKKAATTNDEDEDDNAGVLSWYALLSTLNQYDMDENDDEN